MARTWGGTSDSSAISGKVRICDPSLHETFLQPLDIICRAASTEYLLHLQYLLTPSCIIYQESFQFGITATGALPGSCYSLCVPVQVAEDATFGKQQFSKHTIAISDAGALHTVIAPGQRHISLLIHKNFLDSQLSERARLQLEKCARALQITASQHIVSAFAAWFSRVLSFQDVWTAAHAGPALQQVEDDLATWLDILVENSEEDGSSPPKRLIALSRAMNWLCGRGAQERVSIHDLHRAAAVSQRTLERAFLENFGQNAREYLLQRRLHKVRGLLVEADKDDILVKEAAMACGFYDLARFSHYYRRHFFELPSETLSRPALNLSASRTLTDARLRI